MLIATASRLPAQTATGAARRTDSVRIAGKDYARVTDWARANDLEVRWLKREDTLQLSNRWWKLSLDVDSREAQMNGVAVWLLFPALLRDGTVWISQLD